MTPEILPHLFKKNPHEAKKDYALKADRIICVSQKTKDDFLKYHPDIKEQKIKVIYHGINTEENKTKKVSNLPKKYLLFVGRRKGYKNFANMVKGIKNILKEKDIYLVCVGEEFTPQENDFLSFYQIKNKVKHFYANDDQLKYIYKNALMFIYPSLYEGFGMPILEAMSQKCPVALSNSSCFPEIAQDCGFYFNPVDPSSIEKTIKKIIENKKETNKKIKQGFQLCKTFTWEKTAQKTIETYQEALNE
jgi:glycosyltransferase involved in cell wall biosynthesis